MPAAIISPAGGPYQTNGFQSLSGKTKLQLRQGAASKQRNQGTAEYVAPQWCPTIDVLAVPEGPALRLVRLSGGQTIWRCTLSDHSPKGTAAAAAQDSERSDAQTIRAIAWHPNGRYIAVLHANGTLVQREPTHGDIAHESRIGLDTDELVVALEWVWCQNSNEGSKADDESEQLPLEFSLPDLSTLDKGKPTPSYISPSMEQPTSIIAVTSAGTVWVSINGIFSLPPVPSPERRLPSTARDAKYIAINARMSKDCSRLHVLLSKGQSNGSSSNGDSAVRIVAATLKAPLLASPTPLLHTLASSSAQLSGLCLYLEAAIDLLIKESEAREESAPRSILADTFERVLQDHGVDEVTSPEAEMIRLAVTGRASESTSQFLLAKFKANKLSNWESAGRLGAAVINRLAYQNALPAIERAILATSKLLDAISAEAVNGSLSKDICASSGLEDAKRSLLKAVVVLGWLYARFEEYMVAVREEQRENQEFVDWALFAIQDLNWQNEGSRRIGSDDHPDDADDGSRPVRPHTDYSLLLKFIRKAFRREPDGLQSRSRISDIVYRGEELESVPSFSEAYYDALVDEASVDSLDCLQTAAANTPKQGLPFGFAFHSERLLELAAAKCSLDTSEYKLLPPTCQDAVKVVKSLISDSFSWPSSVLGQSLQWDLGCTDVCIESREQESSHVAKLSAIHQTSSASSSAEMYAAYVSSTRDTLEILLAPQDSHGTPKIASIALEVQIGEDSDSQSQRTVPINPTGISFFDDDALGIVFTTEGSDSPFLGTLEFRNADTIHYFAVDDTQSRQDGQRSSLVFSRLLALSEASSKFPTALSTNGNKGRRCIAVMERRGRYWWPFDMDNEEDEDEDEDVL